MDRFECRCMFERVSYHMIYGLQKMKEMNDLLNITRKNNSYVKDISQYGTHDIRFTRSSRGNNLLTIDGQRFTLNRKIKDASYWECVKLRCGIWLDTKYQYLPNRRGGLNLIYNGFLYTAERRYNSTVNWVCNKNSNSQLKCPARCVTSGNNTIKLSRKTHNHEPVIRNYDTDDYDPHRIQKNTYE